MLYRPGLEGLLISNIIAPVSGARRLVEKGLYKPVGASACCGRT